MPSKYLPPDALVALINKEFGNNTLVRAKDAIGLIKPRISTGSFALDLQLNGGYPEGAITLLEGDTGASKSWTMNTMAKNFLDTHKDAIYILVNAEGTNDALFLKMLGVDIGRTFFLQPDSGEQAWDAVVKVAAHAQRAFIGVDSLDACVPMVEIEGDTGDAKYAPAAKMNNKGFRKLLAVMKNDLTSSEQRITPVFITQLREAIGVMFGDPKRSVGGMGKKFVAMTIVRLTRTKVLRTDGQTAAERQTYGLEIEAHIVKNKGWGEGEKIKYTLYKENYDGFRRGQIDNVTELIPFLLMYKIAQKKGAWITLGEDQYQGDNELAEQLRCNDELRTWCIDQVREVHSKRYEIEPDAGALTKKADPPTTIRAAKQTLTKFKRG